MEDIRTMLNRVASGELSVDQAVLELKKEPFSEAGFDELGFAKLDTHRRLRQGIAEVIYGAGKTAEQQAAYPLPSVSWQPVFISTWTRFRKNTQAWTARRSPFPSPRREWLWWWIPRMWMHSWLMRQRRTWRPLQWQR